MESVSSNPEPRTPLVLHRLPTRTRGPLRPRPPDSPERVSELLQPIAGLLRQHRRRRRVGQPSLAISPRFLFDQPGSRSPQSAWSTLEPCSDEPQMPRCRKRAPAQSTRIPVCPQTTFPVRPSPWNLRRGTQEHRGLREICSYPVFVAVLRE